MNLKVTKKALSFVMALIMLVSTAAIVFVHADEPVGESGAAPRAYETAADGEKLYDVDFSSEYYTHVDDSTTPFDNGGKTYDANGLHRTDVKELWRQGLKGEAQVIEENGKALRINGLIPAYESDDGSIRIEYAESDELESGVESLFAGYLNGFTLENRTYTLDFEVFAREATTVDVFFGNGAFCDVATCDVSMPNIGLQITSAATSLVSKHSQVIHPVYGGAPVFTAQPSGENLLKMKVVLSGGEVEENVTLYENSGVTPKNDVSTWYGDIVPVDFKVYASYVTAQGHTYDILLVSGQFYQPATLPIVFGMGLSYLLGNGRYCGVRDLAIYKGDTYVPYDMHLDDAYDLIDYGEELFAFDTKGITNQYQNAPGYQWTHVGTGTSLNQNGDVFINSVTKQRAHGVYTPSPLGSAWDTGYYEMEMMINNTQTFKIGLISVGDDERIGFNMLPNSTPESLENFTNDKEAYLSVAGNAATMWVSSGDGRGEGVINNDAIKTIVYDTFASEAGAEPTDARLVRDYGANRSNVKIFFNCEDNIITLYEKVNGEWMPISAIDYNGAVERGYEMLPMLDFAAYYKRSNITIQGLSVKKGVTAHFLCYYNIEGFKKTELFVDYPDTFFDEMTEQYAEKYGLDAELAWTEDGSYAIEDYKKHYDNIYNFTYSPYEVKLAPVVSYNEMATDAVLRGVQFAASDDKEGAYDVRFIAAIGDVTEVAAIRFDVAKKIGDGEAVKSTINLTRVSRNFVANGITMSANLIGGDYVAAASIKKEVAPDDVTVTYEVSVSTIAIDGTVTKGNTVTYTFLNGEYVVLD